MAAPTINSPAYWDHRFATDWDAKDGPAQTTFFAELAMSLLPGWLRADIGDRRLSIHDLGCAEGDALPVLARSFPSSTMSGSDISSVAVGVARARHPGFDFAVLDPGDGRTKADVVFCSNTIEHLADWRDRLDAFAALAGDHLVVLAPFRETALFEEHVVSFDFDSLPASVGGDRPMRLAHVAVRATSEMMGSRWVGHQFLAVWSRRPAPPGPADEFGSLDDLDLRGVPLHGVADCLRLAKAAYTNLDDARAALRETQRSAAAAEMRATFTATERENAFITVRVGLENDLHMARFEADRLRGALAAQEAQSAASRDAAMAARAEAETARLAAREAEAAAQAARSTAQEARQARAEAEADRAAARQAENAARAVAAAREREAHAARAEAMAAEQAAAAARSTTEAAEAAAAAALADAEAAREAIVAARADAAADKAAGEARWKAFEAELVRMQAALRADLELFKARLAVSERTGEAATQAKLRSEKAWRTREAALIAARDGLAAEIAELRSELDRTRIEAAADSRGHAERLQARETEWATQRATLATELKRFNDDLAGRERALQASYDSLRQSYARILSMRTFQYLLKALKTYVRLRGDVMTVPPAAERLTVRLDRLPVDRLLPAGAASTPSPGSLPETAMRSSLPPAAPAVRRRPRSRPPGPLPKPGTPCVLQLVSSLDRGGLEQVVYDLACGFMAAGRLVVTVAIERGGAIADRLVAAGGRVETLGGWDARAFAAVVDDLPIAAVLAHHCYDGLDLLAGRGIPVVEVVHNTYHWLQNDVAGYHARTAAVTRYVATSMAVGDFHAEVFGVPRDAIDVIWNPMNSEGFIRPERHMLERMRNRRRDTFTFLSVANFTAPKAHALLLSAFAEVHAALPQTRLCLVGASTDVSILEAVRAQIAAAGLGDAVELRLDAADRRTLSQVYATAHVFVQPSVHEGFSIAMLEAAHFALPMILTEVGGAADCIGSSGCGLLVPPPLATLKGVGQARVEEAGREPAPPNRTALVEAMRAMATGYADWIERGFKGQAWAASLTVAAAVQRYEAIFAELPEPSSRHNPEART